VQLCGKLKERLEKNLKAIKDNKDGLLPRGKKAATRARAGWEVRFIGIAQGRLRKSEPCPEGEREKTYFISLASEKST